ncbi:MAG TPA: glycoside hydrolase [Candidatus Coprenecus stercoravium]|uniref:exo-alpha-sialidase n=1 Tax=Candidatus Coprenecus stercoravium TaxID=2840735 RepID=A0A9D2KAQ6_9BACT|nr:glycoside hydrolase [Candidatus Coprenecus stercoravium]
MLLLLVSPMPALSAQDNDSIYRQVLFSVDRSDTARAVWCYRIPALTTAPDGSIIAAIDERVPSCGDLQWNRNINIVARRSTDGGRTWGPEIRVVDFPDGESASDPSMITDTWTGTVWLFYNYMDQDREMNRYRFHVVSSRDNGLTWSEPVDITPQVAPKDWSGDFKFITSGQGAFTRDGRMLHTMVNLQRGLFLIVSDDHGMSWYRLPAVIQPADESKVVELYSGAWMINSRVNNEGCRYIHVSRDRGQTWKSRPVPDLPDPGCNGAIIHYPYYGERGCLLFINASDPSERRQLTIHYSIDHGETWSKGLTVVDEDVAYSDITVLQTGEIVLFYERNGYTVNEVAVIPRDALFPQ